jgi:hypothetical protein
MQLQTIDKVLYRKRLNILIAINLVVLLVTSLSVSNILIAFFGSEINGDNIWWNVVGVLTGLVVMAGLSKVLAKKPFMAEINYVRSLKREMNRIYRSSKKVLASVDENNEKALIITYFNLQASKQVYELDNNTLTMDELNEKIRLLDEKLVELNLNVGVSDYRSELLSELLSELKSTE